MIDSSGERRAGGPTLLQAFFCGRRTMPDDLRDRLRSFVPEPAPVSLESVEALPAQLEQRHTFYDHAAREQRVETELVPLTVREVERAALHDLEAVLRLVESGRLAVSEKTRRPSTATTRAVAQALRAGEPYPEESGVGTITSFAWPMLVQAAGLAELHGSRLALTAAGRRALGAPAAEVLRKVWERWLATRLLDESRASR